MIHDMCHNVTPPNECSNSACTKPMMRAHSKNFDNVGMTFALLYYNRTQNSRRYLKTSFVEEVLEKTRFAFLEDSRVGS